MGIYNLYFMENSNNLPKLIAAECTEREAMAEIGKFLEESYKDGFKLKNISSHNTLIYEITGTNHQFVLIKVGGMS